MYIYTSILIDMEQIFSTGTYQERSKPALRQGADRSSIAAEAERFEASSPVWVVTTRRARFKTSGNWLLFVFRIRFWYVLICFDGQNSDALHKESSRVSGKCTQHCVAIGPPVSGKFRSYVSNHGAGQESVYCTSNYSLGFCNFSPKSQFSLGNNKKKSKAPIRKSQKKN